MGHTGYILLFLLQDRRCLRARSRHKTGVVPSAVEQPLSHLQRRPVQHFAPIGNGHRRTPTIRTSDSADPATSTAAHSTSGAINGCKSRSCLNHRRRKRRVTVTIVPGSMASSAHVRTNSTHPTATAPAGLKPGTPPILTIWGGTGSTKLATAISALTTGASLSAPAVGSSSPLDTPAGPPAIPSGINAQRVTQCKHSSAYLVFAVGCIRRSPPIPWSSWTPTRKPTSPATVLNAPHPATAPAGHPSVPSMCQR